MNDSFTGLAGMLLISAEAFAALTPEEDVLYIVKGKNSFRLYLGELELLASDQSAVHSDSIRYICKMTEDAYQNLSEIDPETEYHIYDAPEEDSAHETQ